MRSNRKGTILIVSLWILAILSILAIGIGFRAAIEVRLSKYHMDKLKGLYLAKAGIFKTQEILSWDSSDYDTIRECGMTIPVGKESEDIFKGRLGDGSFAISYDEEGKNLPGMIDEERKINVNTVSSNVLKNLLVNEGIAASIINWRSLKGSLPMQNGTPDSYYETLPAPYKCKHAPFSCIEELMLIKDFTPEVFESIKDYVTIYGDGKININTTTRRVMLALGLSEEIVATIIMFRNGQDKIPGTKDDNVFSDIAAQTRGWNIANDNDIPILGDTNLFTTKSNYFTIESKGMADRSKITSKIVCVVKRGDKKLQSYREY